MTSALVHQGLLSFPNLAVRAATNIAVDASKSAKGMSDAIRATRKTIPRLNAPLLSASSAGAIRTAIFSEGEADDPENTAVDPAPEELLQSIDRLQRSIQDQEQEEPIDNGVGFTSPAFEPLPTMVSPPQPSQYAMSPTVLPSDEDRELAMRRAGQSGIAALV